MSENPVMWAVMRVRPPAWTWAMLPCAILFPAAAARADRLPLPAAEQAEVNRAIDEGVRYLKLSQLPNGTWALDGKHAAGYAAFPALTLLEYGVPPDDPAVKQAAAFVRAAAPKMDETYELALSVLFLDRLGRPADERLIQTMALRLVAGQAVTGGWGYRCPVLTTSQSRELLLVLRRINPSAAAGMRLAAFVAGRPIRREGAMQDTMTFPRTRQGVRDLDAARKPVLPVSGGPAPGPDPAINVGSNERLISSLAGGALALVGLSRMSAAGLGLAAVGGALLYRGLTGHCHLYGALGVNTAAKASPNAEIVYRPDRP